MSIISNMNNYLGNYLRLNPFAMDFVKARDPEEVAKSVMELRNSQGISKEELDAYLSPTSLGYFSDADVSYLDFTPYFNSKRSRIAKYREMSLYPEIIDAIDAICNDSIVDNGDGRSVNLVIKEDIPIGAQKRIRKVFDYLVYEVMNFYEKGYDYFRKWLIEAELYGELIMNSKGNDIIGMKILPAFTTAPTYVKGKLTGFVQVLDVPYKGYNVQELQNGIEFEKNQISYVNYGLYGENLLDVRGYLESAIRVYNQLKSLEDAIIVYRLVRAPERRVWNIYTGRLPKGKAEEYIKGLMKRYRKKAMYDPSSGLIDQTANIQSLTHDFWFSKDETGQGTTVDQIGGGMQLGEITDLDWFKEKLYKSLRLPTTRWQTEMKQGPYTAGKMGEVTREEIKFARFVERLQHKFKYFILDPLFTLLRMRGIDKKYINKRTLDLEFTKSNLFKEYKEMELQEARLGLLSSIAGYIATKQNLDQPEALFAREFVLKKYFHMSDEDYKHNEKLLKKNLEDTEELQDEFPPPPPEGEEGGESPPPEKEEPPEEKPEEEPEKEESKNELLNEK